MGGYGSACASMCLHTSGDICATRPWSIKNPLDVALLELKVPSGPSACVCGQEDRLSARCRLNMSSRDSSWLPSTVCSKPSQDRKACSQPQTLHLTQEHTPHIHALLQLVSLNSVFAFMQQTWVRTLQRDRMLLEYEQEVTLLLLKQAGVNHDAVHRPMLLIHT